MREFKDLKIAVAGTGYVGLSIATLLSQHHKVTAVDIIPEKVELINNKKSPIQDEYIEKFLAEKELDLTATLDAKEAYPICFGMLVFYYLFYNTSLNMMRQWIAMAILFMAFSYLILEEKKKYCILTLVACLFHTSAILGFAILIVYVYCTKKREYIKIANFKLDESMAPIKIFVYGCIVLLSLNIIAVILSHIGLSKYIGYIQGNNGLYLLPNQILLRLPVILLFIIRWRKILKEDKLAPFYGAMIALDLLTSQLMSIRIGYEHILFFP